MGPLLRRSEPVVEWNPLLLLSAYSAAIFAVSLLGGRLSALGTMTHARTQVVMSLVSGFILGIAMYHLLPHSLLHLSGPDAVQEAVTWMMFGVILMVFLLHVFHFHQHDFSGEAAALYDKQDHSPGSHAGGLAGIALGLALHAVVEGVALGASVRTDAVHHGEAALAGLGVFLAILVHKPLDAYSIVGMMRAAGRGERARMVANVGFACVVPVTALAAFSGIQLLGPSEEAVVGRTLAFAAGAFLCISLSDLLPEIHFHSHDRGKLIGAFLVGIGLAYGLYHLEWSVGA